MEERTTMNIPVIALRGLTVFPNLTLSFDVEREISIYALDSAMEGDRTIFLVTPPRLPRRRIFIRWARSAAFCRSSKPPRPACG